MKRYTGIVHGQFLGESVDVLPGVTIDFDLFAELWVLSRERGTSGV